MMTLMFFTRSMLSAVKISPSERRGVRAAGEALTQANNQTMADKKLKASIVRTDDFWDKQFC